MQRQQLTYFRVVALIMAGLVAYLTIGNLFTIATKGISVTLPTEEDIQWSIDPVQKEILFRTTFSVKNQGVYDIRDIDTYAQILKEDKTPLFTYDKQDMDYVKNAIDLACMAGAVSSALEAAAQILRDHGETESLPVVQVPPAWPRALLVLARILMVPVVAVARVIAWLEEIFFPHRPDASEVRRRATPRLQMDSRPPRKR